jgi:hypothetical protein
VAKLPAGLEDQISGRVVDLGGSYRIDLVDARDPSLQLRIGIVGDGAESGTVTVVRSGTALCSFATPLEDPLGGSCAGVPVELQVRLTRSGQATGVLSTGAGGDTQ